jgi:tetratricopeptide (TPR) repeat protein
MSRMILVLGLVLATSTGLGAQSGGADFAAGRAAYSAGEYAKAIDAFTRATKADDSNASYHLWLGRALGREINNANVFRRPFIARQLKAAFDRVVALEPGNVAGHEELIEYYRGAPPLMGGGTDKAWAEAEIVSQLSPMRGQIVKASLALRLGDSTRAAKEYKVGATRFPDSLAMVTAAAAYLAATPDARDAFGYLDNWLAKHPNDLVVLYAVGRSAAVSGQQLERGERALRTVLAAPGVGTDSTLPRPAAIHYRLGDIWLRRADTLRAKQSYEAALRLDPKLAGALAALKAIK